MCSGGSLKPEWMIGLGPRAGNLERLLQGLLLIDGPSVPAVNRHRFVKVNEPKI